MCSIDLERLAIERIEGKTLKYCILDYIEGKAFNPQQSVEIEQVKSIFIGKEKITKVDENRSKESFIKEDDI